MGDPLEGVTFRMEEVTEKQEKWELICEYSWL